MQRKWDLKNNHAHQSTLKKQHNRTIHVGNFKDYAAIAKWKDTKVEVCQQVMNYCNTPHFSTGKAPRELTMSRLLKPRTPVVIKTQENNIQNGAEARNKITRENRKQQCD